MEKLKKTKQNQNEKDYIYFNTVIFNAYKKTENTLQATVEIPTSTILEQQNEWEVAIQKATIVSTLPIFGCPILSKTQGNSSENLRLTPFGVCFSTQTADYPAPVIYQSDSSLNPLPFQNGVKDNSNSFYNIYTYSAFLNMINTSIRTAFNAMDQAENLPNGITQPPFLVYDSPSGFISLICQYGYSQAGAPKLYLNLLLKNYLYSLRTFYIGIDQANFKDMYFLIADTQTNWYALPGQSITNPPAYLQFMEEYDTRYLWTDIRSLLITSNTIRSRPEYVPTQINPNSDFPQAQQNNNPAFSVLTSLDISLQDGGAPVIVQYSPNFLKWSNLIGNDMLNNISLSIFFESVNGQLVPCQIPANQSCDITLVFRRKNIF
jgi:hypothetical protein